MREQYKEEYTWYFENKKAKWNEASDAEPFWEQVNRRIVDIARGVWGYARVGRKNSKSKGWNDLGKATVERKEDGWKNVLGAKVKL